MERSKSDPVHIIQAAYDEASQSIKTKLIPTEISLGISHTDGDTITSHPATLVVCAQGCSVSDNSKQVIPPQDCSSLKNLRVDVDGSGTVTVHVSPSDNGDCFYQVDCVGKVAEICGRRVKVMSVNVVGDVHLVGRS